MKLVSKQLIRMPAEIHRPMKRKDWENLENLSALSTAIVEEPVDQHSFIKRRDESENPHSEEEREQVLEVARKKFTSTTKTVPPMEANKLFLDQKVAKLFPHQPQKPVITKNNHEIQKPPQSDDNTDKYTVKSQAVTCQPKNHIVFLKTHKTASSTILNILYRYGDSHNMTFALPLNMHSQLFYPAFFAAHFVEGVRTQSVKEFHILCNHMRFSSQEVSPKGILLPI